MDDAYEELYNAMGTGFLGTTPANFSSGFMEYADNRGYPGFWCPYWFNYEINAYWTAVNYIYAETPVGGEVLNIASGHWYTVRGYYYTENGEYDLICNSSGSGSTLNGGTENLWIGFYEKSWTAFVAVEN